MRPHALTTYAQLVRAQVRAQAQYRVSFAVDVAGSASLALAAVVQKNPDAILLDVKLPGVDGLDLLKSLREIGVKTPIFVMTGYDSTEFGREALERGATGYLAKPFSLAHIDKLIADAVAQPVA